MGCRGSAASAFDRQVVLVDAQMYGLRPNAAVTMALLRRVSWTAAGVAAVDGLFQSIADHALREVPVIRHLAAALPGSTVTALRLLRLATVTAEACCPLASTGLGTDR